jgi:RHS repeat-associated protein
VEDPAEVPVLLEYTAFGEASGVGVGFIPQGFAGGLHDSDTAIVRFRARDYDPSIGRWRSKDPVGFGLDGSNLYAYAGNEPVNLTDPLGAFGVLVPYGCVAIYAYLANFRYPKDDKARHCWWQCVSTRMCGGPVAPFLSGLAWELGTFLRDDWRKDVEANIEGIISSVSGLHCDEQCEERTCDL